jgi:hypothetical protein
VADRGGGQGRQGQQSEERQLHDEQK